MRRKADQADRRWTRELLRLAPVRHRDQGDFGHPKAALIQVAGAKAQVVPAQM
jgi:hypothetical protein